MDLLSNIRFDNIILTIMNNKKIEIHKYEVEAKLEKENGFSNTPFYRTIQRDLDTKQIRVLRDVIYSNEMMPQKKESEIISQLNKLGFRFKSSSSYIYKNIIECVPDNNKLTDVDNSETDAAEYFTLDEALKLNLSLSRNLPEDLKMAFECHNSTVWETVFD